MANSRLMVSMIVTMVIVGCSGTTAVQAPVDVAGGAAAAPVASASPPALPSPTSPPGPASSPLAAAPPPASPPGSVAKTVPATGPFTLDLYRRGIYAMQATWWWCTAATIEMLRNVSLHQTDHSAADQKRYFDYSHAHDSYVLPADEGVDLVGLQAGLRHFVSSAYTLTSSATYDAAVRTAVISLRLSRRPDVLVVDAGRHVWLLTGFTATADPASGSSFRVLSVRIVGPLYGRQSVNGYDPPPDTRLSYDALRRFLLPYHFKFGPTPWDHRFVTYSA